MPTTEATGKAQVRPEIKFGLALSGGGARAAYQAGVLAGLADLLDGHMDLACTPFKVITGESAGCINTAHLAARADVSFREATQELQERWATLRPEMIVDTHFGKLAWSALRWLWNLGFGGAFGTSNALSLLDTAPLRRFLAERIDFGAIRRNVDSGILHAVAITATNYRTGSAITFYDAHGAVTDWLRTNRLSRRDWLSLDHVMASSAIPVLFPPVALAGSYFGDGSVRMTAPLSPVVHLGADRVFTIGVRHARKPEENFAMNRDLRMSTVSLANVAGMVLNAAFLDSMDLDIERLTRINRTVGFIPESARDTSPQALRNIPVLAIRPSVDLGHLAQGQLDDFSPLLRYLMRGLGASMKGGDDLVSYLSFTSKYAERLLDLGYHDLMAQRREVLAFFTGADSRDGAAHAWSDETSD